jgi:hypothetical protein
MSSHDLLIMDHIFSSLSACLHTLTDPLLISQVSNLSPKISSSAGRGLALEDEILMTYCDAIARLTGTDSSRPDIIRAYGLWHLTWGLHLRLGPGLAYLLQKDSIPPESKRAATEDIYRGAQRARAFLAAQN